MRNAIEWMVAIALAAGVWALVFWALSVSIAKAALPPSGIESSDPQVTVTCGYQIIARWSLLDMNTMESLHVMDDVLVGSVPAPCPDGLGE